MDSLMSKQREKIHLSSKWKIACWMLTTPQLH